MELIFFIAMKSCLNDVIPDVPDKGAIFCPFSTAKICNEVYL